MSPPRSSREASRPYRVTVQRARSRSPVTLPELDRDDSTVLLSPETVARIFSPRSPEAAPVEGSPETATSEERDPRLPLPRTDAPGPSRFHDTPPPQLVPSQGPPSGSRSPARPVPGPSRVHDNRPPPPHDVRSRYFRYDLPDDDSDDTLPWVPSPDTNDSLPWVPSPDTNDSLPWVLSPDTLMWVLGIEPDERRPPGAPPSYEESQARNPVQPPPAPSQARNAVQQPPAPSLAPHFFLSAPYELTFRDANGRRYRYRLVEEA